MPEVYKHVGFGLVKNKQTNNNVALKINLCFYHSLWSFFVEQSFCEICRQAAADFFHFALDEVWNEV